MHKREDKVHVARFGSEPPTDRRESVAAVLRRARENHGQDVRSVAQVLRIRQSYLEALESGSFDDLPGTAYALGFLRTYAEYLGLNANNIVDRFKEEAQAPERRTELVFPEPVVEGRIPGGAIILISVVLLTVAYGGWFYLANQGRSVSDLIPGMPDQLQTFLDGEPDRPAAPPAEAPVATAEAPAVAPTDTPAETPVETPAEAGPGEAQAVVPQSAEAPTPESGAAPDETRQATAVPAETPAEPDEPAPPARIAEAPPAETPAEVRAAPAAREAQPAESAQIAALPDADTARDTSTDAYAGPPIGFQSAPQVEAPNRAAAPSLAPTQPDPIMEPLVEPTVVIPAPPSAPRAFAPPGERTPQVYGESNRDARIVLRALQDSWVQVRDGQDALLLTRVLRSGDTYRVPDQAGLTLLTGNAGGIELEVDGIRLAPLGPVGAVRRQIALDPTNLLGRAARQ